LIRGVFAKRAAADFGKTKRLQKRPLVETLVEKSISEKEPLGVGYSR
jgi:hypothetical protein